MSLGVDLGEFNIYACSEALVIYRTRTRTECSHQLWYLLHTHNSIKIDFAGILVFGIPMIQPFFKSSERNAQLAKMGYRSHNAYVMSVSKRFGLILYPVSELLRVYHKCYSEAFNRPMQNKVIELAEKSNGTVLLKGQARPYI